MNYGHGECRPGSTPGHSHITNPYSTVGVMAPPCKMDPTGNPSCLLNVYDKALNLLWMVDHRKVPLFTETQILLIILGYSLALEIHEWSPQKTSD